MYNSQAALKKFGLLTYTQRDFFSLFSSDPLNEKAYKVLVDDYYENQIEHNDTNTYNGEFEDKNFILIMAESLDQFAINETLTPNLYALKTEYAFFENYYSPLYYRSTADSEFLVQTSMYPDKNVTLSMEAYMDNTFPNTLPKLFEEAGYNTYSFHNYFDYFYPRGDFHINTLGYDQFWGSEELGMTSGFDPDAVIFDHVWQSDLELMQRAVPKFINDDEPFFVNMLTVSGHFQYSENHEMAKPEYVEAVQNYFDNLVEPVEYTDEIIYYLAVHMEVDQAIGYLIDELEAAGKMDDTVIMIFGDHYAYGIDNEDIWAYEDGYKTDNDEMDIHNVPMMIISDSTLLSGVQSNYMSTIDVMPTVANLFNLNLDYKAVFGNDALSAERNIVRFADGSFICEDFSYDSLSETYTIIDNSVTEGFIYSLNNQFVNDYMYNLLMLEYDYFKEDEPDLTLPNTLEKLQKQALECHLCLLSKSRTNVVFGEGDLNADLMFIGEAPGATEDKLGKPFVGRSGELLTKMIENVLHIKREEVYITNIVKCRPTDNREPSTTEAHTCQPFLLKQIELIRPKIIVALGGTAYYYLSGDDTPISKVRGTLHKQNDYTLIPTYHPSYLLRNPSAKKDVFEDLKMIKELM